MFQSYVRQCTHEVHQALEIAISELVAAHQNVLTTDQILLGLLSMPGSEAMQLTLELFGEQKGDPQAHLKKLIDAIYNGQSTEMDYIPGAQIVATAEVEQMFHLALKEAKKLGDAFIGTGAMMIALIEPVSGHSAVLLQNAGLDADRARQVLEQMRSGRTIDSQEAESQTDELSEYTQDLTAMARGGELDPVIGREEEIARIIQTLSRRKKNNPVLIGEPGVGKTVIAEGLAQRIADGLVPDTLRNKRVLSLDMAEVVAGAKMRGEFEERLKAVRDAVIDAQGQIILFIDELHTVVGAGEGGLHAPALLKSALAKGQLQVIGADTLDEYHKYVEADKALERRFQPILVREPSISETITILQGVVPRYAAHHEVQYQPMALEAAAQLSDRYISDRKLPDKAIDLIDEAGASKHLQMLNISSLLQKLEKDHQQLQHDKQLAFVSQKFEEVAQLQMKLLESQKALEKERDKCQQRFSEEDRQVSPEDIAQVVARLTGIPVARLAESEAEKLTTMEENLHRRIIGQSDAISAVANAIRRNRTGISSQHRPIGSFLFLGPTGVGKTELAKALAEFLLDDESRIVRLDMSEYMERHEVSKMIGAPPGYIGYGEGGQLTEKIRRNPYTVILLDELEKAHPDVFNMLLQILEDGRLTDAQGHQVSFRNTLLIGTSNLGADALITDKPALGFIYSPDEPNYSSARQSVMLEVKKFFKPEFLNRLDEVIVFHYLTREDVQRIACIYIEELREQMADKQNIDLELDREVIEKLADDGFNPTYGARPLRREVEMQLENPIASLIVSGECYPGSRLHVSVVEHSLQFKVIAPLN